MGQGISNVFDKGVLCSLMRINKITSSVDKKLSVEKFWQFYFKPTNQNLIEMSQLLRQRMIKSVYNTVGTSNIISSDLLALLIIHLVSFSYTL